MYVLLFVCVSVSHVNLFMGDAGVDVGGLQAGRKHKQSITVGFLGSRNGRRVLESSGNFQERGWYTL